MSVEPLTFQLSQSETEDYLAWIRPIAQAYMQDADSAPEVTVTFTMFDGMEHITANCCGKTLTIRGDD